MSNAPRPGLAPGDWLQAGLQTLFPEHCGICATALPAPRRQHLCSACWESLEPNLGPRCPRCDRPGQHDLCKRCSEASRAFDSARAAFVYGGGIAQLLQRAKFQGQERLCVALGRLLAADPLARALAQQSAALCVPLPLSLRRGRQRGYNQSAIIARTFAAAVGMSVGYVLRRRRHDPAQSTLDATRRRGNVRGAFVAAPAIVERDVVLVDDVLTTGATVESAAEALCARGVKSVRVLAVAISEGGEDSPAAAGSLAL